MEFCPECSFMLYTKLIADPEDTSAIKKNLVKYCKNCGYTGEKITNKLDKCVYKRQYDNNYIVDRIQANKYTIFDNTLPVLAIDCINKKCITNITDTLDDNIVIIDNLPEYYTEADIRKITLNDTLMGLMDSTFETIQVQLTNMLVKAIPEKKTDLIEAINKIVIEHGEKDETLHAIEYNSEYYKKEVIYIKYDPDNMKYMYICRNCSESWLGNN